MREEISKPGHVTQLLTAACRGSDSAVDKLLPLVYGELRRLSNRYFNQERRDHTLQPTALVHEAYLKLVVGESVQWEGRAHFFRVAARAMRRILVDHAIAHTAGKRGGGAARLTLDESLEVFQERAIDLEALNNALEKLREMDERLCQVVELLFFAGLTQEEAAEILGVTDRTIRRDWTMARTWLRAELGDV